MTYPLAPCALPSMPNSAPAARPVSPEIVDTMVDLFDNATYSDVVFKFPRRNGVGYRTIYASKKLLARRSEYFRAMFEGGFAESTPSSYLHESSRPSNIPIPVTRKHNLPATRCLRPPPVRPPVLEDFDEIDDDDSDADSDFDEEIDREEQELIPAGPMELESPRKVTSVRSRSEKHDLFSDLTARN